MAKPGRRKPAEKRKPIKRRKREYKNTKEWKPAFLAALENVPVVRDACTIAGVTRSQAYLEKSLDEEFKAAWDAALAIAIEGIEAIAWHRAQAKSDTLLIFLLNSHKPELYKQKRDESDTDDLPLLSPGKWYGTNPVEPATPRAQPTE